MKLIASTLARQAGQVCILVASTADWNQYGEAAWAEMLQGLHQRPPTRRVMGVDSEWFKKNPLAVVQFSTPSHCFVIHLSYLEQRALPMTVRQALEDASIVKCGVGIHEDVKRLRKEQNIDVQTVMNLEHYAVSLGLAEIGQTNLAALAERVCGVEMVDKVKAVTISNWELPLNEKQQRYAADDAVASFLVGDKLLTTAMAARNVAEDDADFNVAEWLSHTRTIVHQRFEAAQKARQRALNEAQHAQQEAAKEAANGSSDGVMKPFWSEGSKIRVLSKEGKYLFDCSTARAKFYVKEKGIAEITKYRPNSTSKAEEIRLLFDPQVKTRLCLYDAVGLCELGKECPYAHGVGELTEDARQLITSSQPSCACCLAASNHLMKRAVVPPSFRKHLPEPLCFPPNTDFVPICQSCNSVVMHYIDDEMHRCYKEAETLMAEKNEVIPMMEIGKTISYARLLSDSRKTAKIPQHRLDSLTTYVWEHWELTHMRELEARFAAMRRDAARHSNNSNDDDGEGDENGDEDSGDRGANEHLHEDRSDAERPDHGTDAENTSEVPNVSGPLTFPASRGDVDQSFLKRLSVLVPGEIRSFLVMQALMDAPTEEDRQAKAKAFVERWRAYLVNTCKIIDKESNVLSNEQWQTLKKTGRLDRAKDRIAA